MYRDYEEEVIVEHIPNKRAMAKKIKPLYIIHNYMKDEATYKEFQTELLNYMRGCIEHKECREYPINFKFYQKDNKTYTLPFRHFLINVYFWYIFINLKDVPGVMTEEFIFDCVNDVPKVNNYINKLIIKLNEYTVKSTIANESISEALANLRGISTEFSLIMNLNINLMSFMEPYLKNDRIREIMSTDIEYGMQPYEIEKLITELTNEEIELYKKYFPNNPISIMLRAGTGLKKKQLGEFTIAGGLKPSLDGSTIPVPISHSYLIGGTAKPSEHYVDSIASRKSLIMNKKEMGRAGKKLPA